MVTGSYDNTAKIWDAVSGKELQTLRGYVVNSAAFSSDGKRVVTGSMDNTAKIWDAVDWTLTKEQFEKQRLEHYQAWLKKNAAKPNHQGRGTGQGND